MEEIKGEEIQGRRERRMKEEEKGGNEKERERNRDVI